MKKNLLLLIFVILVFVYLQAETVEYGFLSFDIPGDFQEAASLYPQGFALKKGTLDPNHKDIGEGVYINVSISTDIGEAYIPQWETEEAKKITTKEIVEIDGLQAFQYYGYMMSDENVWFSILYLPLIEIETKKEILFITMLKDKDERLSIDLVEDLFKSIKISRPVNHHITEVADASLSFQDGDDGVYLPGEVITLNFTINEKYMNMSPWICIVPSEIEHGSSDNNDLYDLTYAFLKSSEGEVQLWAPEEQGKYEFRINSAYFDGVELLSLGFEVIEE